MNTQIVFFGGIGLVAGGSVLHAAKPDSGYTMVILGAVLAVCAGLMMLSTGSKEQRK